MTTEQKIFLHAAKSLRDTAQLPRLKQKGRMRYCCPLLRITFKRKDLGQLFCTVFDPRKGNNLTHDQNRWGWDSYGFWGTCSDPENQQCRIIALCLISAMWEDLKDD
jgi:hypothetical protein